LGEVEEGEGTQPQRGYVDLLWFGGAASPGISEKKSSRDRPALSPMGRGGTDVRERGSGGATTKATSAMRDRLERRPKSEKKGNNRTPARWEGLLKENKDTQPQTDVLLEQSPGTARGRWAIEG